MDRARIDCCLIRSGGDAASRGAAFAVVIAAALVTDRLEWSTVFRDFLRMSDEARVVSMLGAGDIILHPLTPPATMLEMKKFTGTPGDAFYDDLPICEGLQVHRLFEYDAPRREVREIPVKMALARCAEIRNAPLSLQLHFDPQGALVWHAGPYADGQYAFILADGIVAYPVPRQGVFKASWLTHFQLRLRYTSPSRWRTYTPLLPVHLGCSAVNFKR